MQKDFLKAISGQQPAELFRVHCNLTNGMIGITAWYTMAVYDDFLDEVKSWPDFESIYMIEKQTNKPNK